MAPATMRGPVQRCTMNPLPCEGPMRKALLLLPFIIALSGFTQPPFDANSVQKARAARKLAIDACGARKDFKSSADVVDCVATADSDFAHAVRLNDSKILGDYMAGV